MKMLLPLLFIFTVALSANPVSQAQEFLKSQQQEKAFSTFLEALKLPIKAKASESEGDTYSEALRIYLDPHKTPTEIAKEILTKYSKESEEHPEWHQLGYLISVANANQAHFDCFFDRFWKSYEHYPEHFLVYKVQAVLHIKLLERAPTPEAREKEKREIVHFVQKAMDVQPGDHSLYRFALTFCTDAERPKILAECLNKIINSNTITPRADVKFYVQQAVEFKQYELAQRYIDKAREWYQVSRVVSAAQEYLDQEKGAKAS